MIEKLNNILNIDNSCGNYNELPSFKLMFKESQFSKKKNREDTIIIDKQDYVMYNEVSANANSLFLKNEFKLKTCELAFIQINSPFLVLGLRFLKKYYTIFDFERNIIGISTMKNTTKSKYGKNYNDHVFKKDEIESLIDQFRINNEWTQIGN